MRRRKLRLAAVSGTAVLAAVCASGSEFAGAGSVPDPGPLPAERYETTAEDHQRSQRATALLVRRCMADRGHPDFPLDPRYPDDPVVGAAVVVTGSGAVDLDDARRWGYGWDPEQSPAVRPQGRRMTAAEYADYPACSAAAGRRLMRGIDVERDWAYPSRRSIAVDKAVERDPRARAAWAAWSRCMGEQGFERYPTPVAAYTDDAWRRGDDGNTRHTRRERATAVADVTCKLRHRTTEIVHAVEAGKQAADIARHPGRYAAALRSLETYRDNIADVLRKLG
ncbi:hypothetical protein [Streptomyces sp. MAR4 CNX-425]|uniref:hypothetical protein n=1 Tax=Streptomyces sp. MAR4 CNX-425 TaxID=3406343 RepID=UPI003B508FC1